MDKRRTQPRKKIPKSSAVNGAFATTVQERAAVKKPAGKKTNPSMASEAVMPVCTPSQAIHDACRVKDSAKVDSLLASSSVDQSTQVVGSTPQDDHKPVIEVPAVPSRKGSGCTQNKTSLAARLARKLRHFFSHLFRPFRITDAKPEEVAKKCHEAVNSDTQLLAQVIRPTQELLPSAHENHSPINESRGILVPARTQNDKEGNSKRIDLTVTLSAKEEKEEIFYDAMEEVEKETVEDDDDEFVEALEYQPDTPEKAAPSATEPQADSEPVVLDFLTGLPTSALKENAHSMASALLSPAGSMVEKVAKKCLPSGWVEKGKETVQGVVKAQIDYEVDDNTGRRLAQLASVVGVTSPLIPFMLQVARCKDVKDELSALKQGDATPLLADLAMTYGPWIITLLLQMAS